MMSIIAPQVHGVLLDIEGTTTPISFVHDVLFPFARSRVRDYLLAQQGSDEIAGNLAGLLREHASDEEQDMHPPPLISSPRDAEIGSIVSYVNWLMDRDRKSTALKYLQGRIWRQGYNNGVLKAPVFADVALAFERWGRAGVKISIFSSGSVLAQKLLFAHTEDGDLSKFIDEYFDTTSGPKKAAESYRHIAQAMELAPQEVLFISDIVVELDAAKEVGMQTRLCLRPGNHPQSGHERHEKIHSFEETFE